MKNIFPSKRRQAKRLLMIPLGMVLVGSLSGCYYMHLASGQMKLIFGSVPVEDALKKGSLSDAERERLQMVARIKEFGVKRLGLKSTGSYETVYLKSRQNPLYTVSASPKDRLSRVTWWFPIVGDMPYLGFFDVKGAERKEAELLKQDLDVIVSRAEAYSTLGWFKDPVTLNLLEEGTVELAETILHEMTHTTMYVKDQGEFNEGLAVLVGLVGAAQFFEETCGPAHEYLRAARDAVEDERRFSLFLDSLMSRLEELYRSTATYDEKLARRTEVFEKAMEEFGEVKKGFRTKRYSHFGGKGMNNAYLMALGLYHRHFPLFEAWLRKGNGSVEEMLGELRQITAAEGTMLEKMNEEKHVEREKNT